MQDVFHTRSENVSFSYGTGNLKDLYLHKMALFYCLFGKRLFWIS